MRISLAIPALLCLTFVALGGANDDCKPGDVWAEGKIKMLCTHDGTKPVACLPNAKLGDNELQPGQQYSTPVFKFECTSNGEFSLVYEVIGCYLPDGKPLSVGEQAGVANKGLYKCQRNADNTISRKYQAGCWFNDRIYTSGQAWKTPGCQVTCVGGNGNFEARATGCISENGELVNLGAFTESKGKYFKCQGHASIKHHANLVQAGVNEYHEWFNSISGGEEEAAEGDSGSGFTRPPTTRPTTPPPTTTTPPPTTTTPEPTTTTEAPTTRRPTNPPTTTRFVPDTTTAQFYSTTQATKQCQDFHPICRTLCAKQECPNSRPNIPARPAQQWNKPRPEPIIHDTESIGFALGQRNLPAKTGKKNIFGLIFGSHSHGKDKPSSNKFALGTSGGSFGSPFISTINTGSFNGGWNAGSPSTRRPVGNNGAWSNTNSNSFGGSWGSHSGWSNSWSSSWSQGGSGSSGGSGFGSGFGSFATAKPQGKPGKPHHHHHDSSDDSSESCEGHGHGHGHGQGQGQGQNQGFGGFGVINQGHGHGQFNNAQCSNSAYATSARDLVNALCPLSCGTCFQQIDLNAAAAKYASAHCTTPTVNEPPSEPIGFAFEEDTTLGPQPSPGPSRPGKGPKGSGGKSKGKGSGGKSKGKGKGKNKSKNKSKGKKKTLG